MIKQIQTMWRGLFCVFAGSQSVWTERRAVLLWSQLWAPTPPVWETWTWAVIMQETQECSLCLLDYRIYTGHWALSGMQRTRRPRAGNVLCHTVNNKLLFIVLESQERYPHELEIKEQHSHCTMGKKMLWISMENWSSSIHPIHCSRDTPLSRDHSLFYRPGLSM